MRKPPQNGRFHLQKPAAVYLTRRQEEFIENLIALSQELDGPIHYSTLAERLGGSPFTAYDMLRVLEEKGMVTSKYQLPRDKAGPGRAERLFYPAVNLVARRRRIAARFGATAVAGSDLRQLVLDRARRGQFADPQLAADLLARVSPEGSPEVRYCVEVMAVVALRLRQHPGRGAFLTHVTQMLPSDGSVTPANLCLLIGFAFGFIAHDRAADEDWSRVLTEHVLQFQEIVALLSPDDRRLLADHLLALFATPSALPS